MAKKIVTWYLVFLGFAMAFVPRVDAFFAPSSAREDVSPARERDMRAVVAVLERKVVGARLLDLGFTPYEVEKRLSSLSDRQMRTLASSMEELKVGGEAEGLLIGALVIALVIFLILPLLGIRVWR